ncbi:MAG: hypothetical protein NZL93_03780 [Chthoniobacterales bacterium]|nr:hypothetical protein [Chthoniobacterales bacterium]
MNSSSPTPTPNPRWTRLRVRNMQELGDSLTDLSTSVNPDFEAGQPLLLTAIGIRNGTIHRPQLALLLTPSHLLTAEEETWFDDLDKAAIPGAKSQPPPTSPHHLALAILNYLLRDIDQTLDYTTTRLNHVANGIANLLTLFQAGKPPGLTDLAELEHPLLLCNSLLTAASDALASQETAARQIRRLALRQCRNCLSHLEELQAAQQTTRRRIEFLIERQRILARSSGEVVACSDMTVTKIFTVIWAIFIPGTALINWYGQNFQFMPELSWGGSLWTQLLATLFLSIVPIWVIIRSGALR